ncbi:hypothetical protein PAHAL_5G268800 [Panicum hallii]|uniref:Uncharacterized protein n=1 Tax=Panicum hallii TaxID=206008 RepID=A0A2T8ILD7_9POAL|nr:hypothetical protein PAHAL_5G268800 [Panicum hallii]
MGMFRMPRRRERWCGAAWAGLARADGGTTVGGRGMGGRNSNRKQVATGTEDTRCGGDASCRRRARMARSDRRRWVALRGREAGRDRDERAARRAGPATNAASLICSPQAAATNGARAGPPQRRRLPVRGTRGRSWYKV